MKLTLKLDENGHAVLQDGKPVYVTEDGKDFVADVPSLYGKTLELKGEAKREREKKEAAEAQVAAFQQLFPEKTAEEIAEFITQANEALTTVQNLDQKKLLDAGKVDQIKAELQDAHNKNLQRVKTQFAEKEAGYQAEAKKKDGKIFELLVGNAFASSPFFSGKDPKTLLPPDAALALFGKHFKVEEDKATGELRVVGMYGDTEIISKQPEMVGEIAPIEEAIEYIIERYPHKDRIIAAGRPGSGAGGGEGGGGGGTDEITKLQKQIAAAKEAKDGRALTTLQTQLFNLQHKQQGAA